MAKKKKIKKIQSKKLEDRIAPGMVGGGLVDPGMVDAVDVDSDSEGAQDEAPQTEAEHLEGEDAPQSEYLDDASQAPEASADVAEDAGEGEQLEDEEIKADENYDEFSEDDPQAEVAEDEGGWQEADWVTEHADGAVDISPPEGVSIDADAGIANFPVDVANAELPIPDDVEITAEGGLEITLPEGSEFLEESNQLLLQDVSLDEIPEGLDSFENPDGSIMINLPDDGVEIDPEAGTMTFDNYWANELAPENIDIQEDGAVDISLPDEGIEYNDDGSIHMNAEASDLMSEPPNDFYAESDYSDVHADGSVTITPPDGVEVDGGVVEMDYEVANEQLDLPEEFNLNADGTSSFDLPEGTEYNEDINGLVFPEGEINLDEVPEGLDAHINPDGTTTVLLAEGIEYDADGGQVNLDQSWTNEVLPDQINFEADGQLQIALPEGTEFYEDGSFNIPADQADFFESEAPEYVDDVDWSEPIDGGYEFTPPEGMEVDADNGELKVPFEMIDDQIPLDEEISFNEDGTMSVALPEGTEFNADTNELKFPEGTMTLDEIPEEVDSVLNDDGSITASLEDGMTYDVDANSVELDNYWTNELSPEAVEVSPDGSLTVDLPEGTEFHDDGGFTIAEGNVDFLENPDPSYSTEGPDWISGNPDGSVTFESNENFSVDTEAGEISMSSEYVNEAFEDYTPENVEFNEDGTMTASLPEGTTYDADANALTFTEGEMHINELPEELNPELNDDGSITVTLPDGMDYDADAGEVSADNYWTNELTPDSVEFSTDGEVTVDLPHDAHVMSDGSVNIPADSADFIEDPNPDFVENGPDWVNDNPDGSVTIETPEGVDINAEEGTMSMSADVAMEEFGESDQLPEELQLNADGTANLQIPEDIQFEFDAEANSFTLTDVPEDFNVNEVPEFLEISYDDDGNVQVTLPEGVSYDADAGSINLSNEIVNEMLPEPVEFTAEGQVNVDLPDETQFFEEQGAFVIPSESVDFMEMEQEESLGDEAATEQMAS